MKNKGMSQSALFTARRLLVLLSCSVVASSMVSGALLAFFRPETATKTWQRTLTFADRVAYQRAIEEVYWRDRIWPKDHLNPKPLLSEVMSAQQIEKRYKIICATRTHWKPTGRSRLLPSSCKPR
jgi:hypothetical protein